MKTRLFKGSKTKNGKIIWRKRHILSGIKFKKQLLIFIKKIQ